MESLFLEAQKIPFSDKVLLDRDPLLDLIDQIRVSVPEDISKAQDVLLSLDGLMSKAEEEAGRIIREAEAELEARLRETDIMREAELRSESTIAAAQQDSERIIRDAEKAGQRIREQADRYCLDLLKKLESNLSSQLSTVKGGIKTIEADFTMAKNGASKDSEED